MGDADFNYLDTFQTGLCSMFLVAIGYLCGKLKYFSINDALYLKKAMLMFCLSSLVFRQIALNQLSYRIWSPFINGILVQASFHIIYAIVCLVFPFKSKIGRYMTLIYSTCCTSYVGYGIPLTQFVFGEEYAFIPTLLSLVHHVFLIPFHTYFIFHLDKIRRGENPIQRNNNDAHSDIPSDVSSRSQNSLNSESGSINDQFDPTNQKLPHENSEDNEESALEGGIDESKNPTPIIKIPENELNANGNSHDNCEQKERENIEEVSTSSSENSPKQISLHVEESSEPKTAKQSKSMQLLFQIVTPVNVCAILGIIWSAIGWEFPIFLENFTKNLSICVVGLRLFTTGVFMHENPFCGGPIPEVIVYLLLHFILLPLVSLFWCWVCKVESSITKICVIVNAMPNEFVGYVLSLNSGYGMKAASYTFFWSNIIGLPFMLLWVIAFNEI
ncbi:Auxin Efflux Carrier family protein [Tritrichomonas foetus]|uniref:Auxin Efflux Carrier family protein n=1 Tax=Tritrichomonas foetus TaxID=1144522 RepID=A0A1J4L1J3_9EUKA|nr:Auxin Efflux Carrier family protein [Tritrichomonas foetus]|eukprot:OHT17385.1 Auxin Efflux Carrier family protein [Tritrichomonas foetus]